MRFYRLFNEKALKPAVFMARLLAGFLGTMAALGRRGRWAVIASGLHLLGSAISPVLRGLIVIKFGYITLAWTVFSVCLVSLAVLLTVV